MEGGATPAQIALAWLLVQGDDMAARVAKVARSSKPCYAPDAVC